MILCGIDIETTSLSLKEARIIQIAYALYDTDFKEITHKAEILLYDDSYPESDESALEAHKLMSAFLKKHGNNPRNVFSSLLSAIERSEYMVAHNGRNFDFPILEAELKRAGLPVPNIPKIDTREDIKFPKKVTSKRLSHLMTDHGGILDPLKAHRALYDVEVMLAILSCYDINEVITRSKSKQVKIIATIPIEKNHLVKEKRFSWNKEKRQWEKMVLEVDLPEFTDSCSFPIRIEG